MAYLRLASFAVLFVPLAGCHSAYVEASVRNQTEKAITLVELDYPSASFGTQALAVGSEYKYRFKVLGSGDVKLIYTDSARQEHDVKGPSLNEGDEGPLVVTIGANGVDWDLKLKGK
jgi:hypothetical protein